MIYKIKVGNKEHTVQANSIESAESFIESKYGKGKVVVAPTYPEVEVTSVPMDEIEEVEDELEESYIDSDED